MNNLIEILNSGGEKFVDFALSMLVQSSVLIVILLAADLLLRKKARAALRYWLWMLVLVKLVLPPTLSSPLSFGQLAGDKFSAIANRSPVTVTSEIPAPQPAPVPPDAYPPPYTGTQQTRYAQVPLAQTEPDAAARTDKGMLSSSAVMLVIWAGAAGAMLLLVIQRLFFVLGLSRQAAPAAGLLPETLEFCRRKMGVNLPVKLKISANATSPAVCGLFRPVILVPHDLAPTLGPGHLRAVLLHELGHIKRGDLWVNLVQTVLQVIYFYNPLLWLANAVIRRIREQAVDEMVQVAMAEKAKDYPETLLSVAKLAFGRPASALRLIGVVESKSQLKGRIKKMLNQPIPKTAKLGLAGLAAIIITAVLLLPMATAIDDKKSEIAEKSEFKATLANGVAVELVGVCDYPSQGKQWWRPDGSQLVRNIVTKDTSNYTDKNNAYEVAYDVKAPNDVSVGWPVIQGSTSSSGLDVIEPAGIEAVRAHIAVSGHSTTVKIPIASGPWTTIAQTTGQGQTNKIFGSKTLMFGPAEGTAEKLVLTTSDDLDSGDDYRLIAFDKQGNLHTSSKNWFSIKNLRQSTFVFVNLAPDAVDHFEFQTRPYHWVTFKNVSLDPGYKTDVQIDVEKPATPVNDEKAPRQEEKTSREDLLRKQLQTAVTLEFSPGMSFSDAIEVLKNSVEPPLNIVVMWQDLYDNADIERDTKINVDRMSAVSLQVALKLLLRSVSGFAKLDYALEDGVIVIATEAALPEKTGTGNRVEDNTPAENTEKRAGFPVKNEPSAIVKQAVLTISTCTETDPRVAQSLESLDGLDEEIVVKELADFLRSDKNTVRRAALYILWKGKFENIKPAVDEMIKLCEHEEEFTRGMAALALGANKEKESFAALCKMTLEDQSSYARRCAAYALGQLGVPQAEPTLEKALKDPDFNVRNNAEAALTMISQQEQYDVDANDDPCDAAPRVISTNPVSFSNDVSTDLKYIEVTFDQEMMDGSWSWTGGGDTYPKTTGKPQYDDSKKTCRLPVELEPGKAYWVGINSVSYKNFRSKSGVPAPWYIILFATKDAQGNPTPIPDDMLAEAKKINSQAEETARQKNAFHSSEQIPYTQQLVAQIRPDGTIDFVTTIKQINESNSDITTTSFINSDFVEVTSMSDGKGRPIRFTAEHKDNIYSYQLFFNEPIKPGDLMVYSHKGTMTGLIKPVKGLENTYRYYMRHWPGTGKPTRRIETFILPEDAKLISTTPTDMGRNMQNGRIVLNVNKIIPAGKSITTSFEYSLVTDQYHRVTELAYDDGKSAGKWSFSGGGHGVKFAAPTDGCILKAVKFYGSRYGEYEPPKEDFDLWICDNDFNIIKNFKFPYSLFAKRGYNKWVTLKVDDVKVPKDFAICLAFDPHQTKGIYVYYSKGSGRSYQGIPPEMEPFKDGNWMIRAIVEPPAGQAAARK
jgi:beta-lactamase regulating signal transducer with metallopeptidase domain